jgi:hypothetical protein
MASRPQDAFLSFAKGVVWSVIWPAYWATQWNWV